MQDFGGKGTAILCFLQEKRMERVLSTAIGSLLVGYELIFHPFSIKGGWKCALPPYFFL